MNSLSLVSCSSSSLLEWRRSWIYSPLFNFFICLHFWRRAAASFCYYESNIPFLLLVLAFFVIVVARWQLWSKIGEGEDGWRWEGGGVTAMWLERTGEEVETKEEEKSWAGILPAPWCTPLFWFSNAHGRGKMKQKRRRKKRKEPWQKRLFGPLLLDNDDSCLFVNLCPRLETQLIW